MRAILPILAIVAVSACNTDARQKLEDAKGKAREGLTAVAAAATAQADPYRRQLETRLTALTAKIEALRRELAHLRGDARADAERRVKALEQRRDELARRVRDLGDEGGDALAAAKHGLDEAVSDLESGCEDVREALR